MNFLRRCWCLAQRHQQPEKSNFRAVVDVVTNDRRWGPGEFVI